MVNYFLSLQKLKLMLKTSVPKTIKWKIMSYAIFYPENLNYLIEQIKLMYILYILSV